MRPFLIVTLLPLQALAHICYQCASNNMILNWSRLRLPLREGETMEADNNCLHDEKMGIHSHCPGPCITYNVTMLGGRHHGKVFGVARMCSPNSGYSEIEGCEEEEERSKKGHRILMKRCQCSGDFCNGLKQPPKRNSRYHRPNSGSEQLQVIPLLFLTYSLAFVFM
ncbi:hypothetical protein WR25_06150 [Diploscapter pachys]|uniref:Protein sleepless n=1 Tax=Diploscapter pachys TaxID=2018661 RepID=A0A2A2KQR4_9BILA|nr:hypothetical protein WR25_06150 [Diploscapter pachys]